MPRHDVERLGRASAQARREFGRLVADAPTWSVADVAVRGALAEGAASPEEQHRREQIAAAYIIHIHLLQGPRSTDRLNALAFYTRLLVNNDNPEAGMIARALEELRDHLADDEIMTLADRSVRSASRFVDARVECDGCSPAQLAADMPAAVHGQMSTSAYDILEGIETLRGFSR